MKRAVFHSLFCVAFMFFFIITSCVHVTIGKKNNANQELSEENNVKVLLSASPINKNLPGIYLGDELDVKIKKIEEVDIYKDERKVGQGTIYKSNSDSEQITLISNYFSDFDYTKIWWVNKLPFEIIFKDKRKITVMVDLI